MRLPERRVEVFSLAMNVGFRGVRHREGVLIWGAQGVGEFSPFSEYDDGESTAWLAAAVEAADEVYPPPVREKVPVNCTIPAVPPAQAALMATDAHGCRTAKVKVAEPGQSLDDDVARVASVRDAMGPSAHVRIDANGAWTVSQAVEAVAELSQFDLEYVEQPTATVEELRQVRRRIGIPVAADESIRRAEDPMRVRSLEAADIAVLKVQPLGGVRTCLRLAERIGLPVVVSSALESSVGIAAGIALAAALPELPYACGLATTSMLADDLTDDPLRPVDGRIAVRRVTPQPVEIEAARASADVQRAWLDRLARCQAILESRRR